MSNSRSGLVRASEPAVHEYLIRLLGTGASVPTEEVGSGVTISRTGAGVYKITWTDNPFTFVGVSYCFGAATPSAVKGYTMTRDTFDTTSNVFSLEVSVWDSTFTAADLAANQYLDLVVRFKETALDV